MRRVAVSVLALVAGVTLAPTGLVPSALATPQPGAAAAGQSAQPLPAHSQRPVCGVPAATVARCHAHVVTHVDSAAPLATVTYQSGWSAGELQSAYRLPIPATFDPATDPGKGPTVAIVDAYDNPNAEADLNAYRSRFGLGACTTGNGCFKKVNQTGGSTYPAGDTGWGAEIDLDIEMVAAACPTCKILLVEGKTASFSDLAVAVDYAAAHAAYVSNSYGAPEFSSEATLDSHYNHPGVGITVSSGDNGYGVEYPAASQYVTAVGGTSLTEAAGTSRGWSETAWSGAGSGCSALEQKPTWQHDTGCARRTVADVSAVADPNTGVAVYDSYGSSGANWFVYGGTSVAAPFVAGVWALGPNLTGTNVATAAIPYSHLNSWFDVTSGSNARRCSSYLCLAGTGYDGPTGLGTPIGATGFGGSAGASGGGGNAAPAASFTTTCNGLTCTFTDTSTDSDGTISTRSWNFGDGGTSTSASATHTYAAGGTYTVALTVTDNGGATASTSQTVNVSAPGSFTLTANGYKVKGVESVDLSWSGASGSFSVTRNGATQATGLTGTTYTDRTGNRGGATYTYQVCNSTACSNTVTVVF